MLGHGGYARVIVDRSSTWAQSYVLILDRATPLTTRLNETL